MYLHLVFHCLTYSSSLICLSEGTLKWSIYFPIGQQTLNLVTVCCKLLKVRLLPDWAISSTDETSKVSGDIVLFYVANIIKILLNVTMNEQLH